jgi:hypothetical protein
MLLVFQLLIGVLKSGQEENIYEVLVTPPMLKSFILLPTRAEHPSNIPVQLVGITGDPIVVIFKFAQPLKFLELPDTLISNGPQLLILVIFNLSPLLLNSHPLIVPFIVIVLMPALTYV